MVNMASDMKHDNIPCVQAPNLDFVILVACGEIDPTYPRK